VRRLLLVDDSRSAREALRAAFEPFGLELVEAENGAEALRLLAAGRFDLAFVDLTMPVLDGPALVRMMRARGVDTPVVLVTAGAETPVVLSTIRSGVRDYVAKPFSESQIVEVARRVLGLEPGAWVVRPAEVLVQHPDPAVGDRLRSLVPARVAVTAADVLARTLELCEARAPALVLLDAGVLEGDPVSAAGLVRRLVPGAGVFALAEAAPADAPWRPEGDLDGVLPRALPEAVVRDLLLPVFLRPLVFREGGALRAAGFHGPEAHQAAYRAAVGRALVARAAEEDPSRDLLVDLSAVPADEAALAALIHGVMARLDARGLAPAFRVPLPLLESLRRRPELARSPLLPAL
jgi:CheY-like chemotaxis protein